jgi:putative transposase
MEICIMPSHIHFIADSESSNLSNLLGDFKSFTARALIKAIEDYPQETKKEWPQNHFEYRAKISHQKQKMQFWK